MTTREAEARRRCREAQGAIQTNDSTPETDRAYIDAVDELLEAQAEARGDSVGRRSVPDA